MLSERWSLSGIISLGKSFSFKWLFNDLMWSSSCAKEKKLGISYKKKTNSPSRGDESINKSISNYMRLH